MNRIWFEKLNSNPANYIGFMLDFDKIRPIDIPIFISYKYNVADHTVLENGNYILSWEGPS